MAIVETKHFLKSLIQTGADASLNLFEVSFLPATSRDITESKISVRTTNFTGVATRDSNTVSLPYQNIDILKISSGTTISKTQTFSVRVDDDYTILNLLRSFQCIDSSGKYIEDPAKKFTNITVTALKPMVNSYYKDNFCTVYKWVFKNCYITNIVPLEFSYSNANQGSLNITFIWGDYEEGIFNANESPEQISGDDIYHGLLGSTIDALKGW